MNNTRFIYGFHAITAKLRYNTDAIVELYYDNQRHDGRLSTLLKRVQEAHPKLRCIAIDTAALTQFVGHQARHQGVVARIHAQERQLFIDDVLDTLESPALLLILDEVTDPHNLGACLRVADAAGAHAVIAPRDRSAPLNAQAIKVASGAADTVPYIQVTNLATTLRSLKEREIWILGTADDETQSLYDESALMRQPMAWVVGSESQGLRRLTREHCDSLVSIPMQGTVESLNVSVAAGICLFETCRVRSTTK